MKFTDRMTVDASAIRETDDGLVVQARVARGGNVQDYLGAEMGVAEKAIVRIYRPEDEVFARKAFQTYARKPITIGHPKGGVSADTWKDLAVGEIDRDVVRDGEFVSVPLLFRDGATIAAIKDGTAPRELSMGYEANVQMQDGVTPSGEPYDAVMADFKMNHVALVATARGGKELRIGDGADARWGASPITFDRKDVAMADAVKTRTVLIDGLSVETTDAGAQALEKLQKTIADGVKALADATAAHDAAIAKKDGELAAKDAKITDLEGKILSDADLDARVAARADLIGKAKALVADVDVAGKSDADIRKAVVVAKRGAAVADKSAAYIDAAFDLLTEDADKSPDPVRVVLKDSKPIVTDTAKEDAAYAAYLADFNPQDKEAN